VQPDTQPHLAQTTTQQQLQLSPFLITIPNLTPHLQHVCLGIPKPKQGSPNQNGDARRKNLRTDSGILKQKQGSPNPYTKMVIPKAKWGCASNESPNRFGDPETKRGSPNPHTKTRIPKAKWGCASNESPNRFGDPRTKMGIKTSSYQNGDPRTKMGMHKTMNPQTDSGIPEPKWGSRHPHTKTEIPEPKWGCKSQRIPKPIRGSPNKYGDCSVTARPESVWGLFLFGTLGFRPQIGTAFKMGTTYQNGDPRIGLGRDLSIFQIGESQNRFGVHSNLGTNINTCLYLAMFLVVLMRF